MAESESRDRILSSACTLFHRKGYTGVGVADICASAGVVKGSFYHFFPAKQDLLGDVLRHNWEVTGGALGRLLESDGSGRERIRRFLDLVVGHAARMHETGGSILGCNIGVLASELGPALPDVQPQLKHIFEAWLDYLERLVEAGRQDGSIGPGGEARDIAQALLASIQGMSVLGRTFNDPHMLQTVADRAMDQIP